MIDAPWVARLSNPADPPNEKRCLPYNLVVHLEEVLDHAVSTGAYGRDTDGVYPRCHFFPWFVGSVDGTSPTTSASGGAHAVQRSMVAALQLWWCL